MISKKQQKLRQQILAIVNQFPLDAAYLCENDDASFGEDEEPKEANAKSLFKKFRPLEYEYQDAQWLYFGEKTKLAGRKVPNGYGIAILNDYNSVAFCHGVFKHGALLRGQRLAKACLEEGVFKDDALLHGTQQLVKLAKSGKSAKTDFCYDTSSHFLNNEKLNVQVATANNFGTFLFTMLLHKRRSKFFESARKRGAGFSASAPLKSKGEIKQFISAGHITLVNELIY